MRFDEVGFFTLSFLNASNSAFNRLKSSREWVEYDAGGSFTVLQNKAETAEAKSSFAV